MFVGRPARTVLAEPTSVTACLGVPRVGRREQTHVLRLVLVRTPATTVRRQCRLASGLTRVTQQCLPRQEKRDREECPGAHEPSATRLRATRKESALGVKKRQSEITGAHLPPFSAATFRAADRKRQSYFSLPFSCVCARGCLCVFSPRLPRIRLDSSRSAAFIRGFGQASTAHRDVPVGCGKHAEKLMTR